MKAKGRSTTESRFFFYPRVSSFSRADARLFSHTNICLSKGSTCVGRGAIRSFMNQELPNDLLVLRGMCIWRETTCRDPSLDNYSSGVKGFLYVFQSGWISKKPLGEKFAFSERRPSLQFTPEGRTASASAPLRKAKSFSRLSGGHEDEPAQGRRQSRLGTWTRFREGKATNHRAGPCFVRGGSQPARLGPGRCEVRATPWNSPNVHAP